MAAKAIESHTVLLPVTLTLDKSGTEGPTDHVATLTVFCPLKDERILLQRCSFCQQSEGLLLDPKDASLTLRCRMPELVRVEPDSMWRRQ